MSTHKIPNEYGNVRQISLSDTSGEIVASKNIDLRTEIGKIKLARPFVRVREGEFATHGDVIRGLDMMFEDVWYLTEESLYANTASDYRTWNRIVGEVFSNAEDFTYFGGQMVIVDGTDMTAWDGDLPFASNDTPDWWTDRGNPALISNAIEVTAPHILHISRVGAETLLVTDGHNVHAYTGGIASGAVLSTTVDLGDDYTAICLTTSIRKSYIGTYTESASEARVFEWDTASTNYTQSFPVGAKCVLAIATYQDTPIIITERGEIKMFNNAGFETIAQFPFTNKPEFVSDTITGFIEPQNTSRPIHPKGVKVDGDFMYIYANWTNHVTGGLLDEETPAGLWVLNFKTLSLTHLGSQDNESTFGNSTPLLLINDPNTRILMAGSLRRAGSEYPEGIWIEDLETTSTNTGYIVTKEFESNSVADTFNRIYIKALLGQDDEIMVKYRMKNDVLMPVIVGGTGATEEVVWLDEYTFNTTEDLSYIQTRFEADEFDEVEITLGQGAGEVAHITNVTSSATVYTVTIDRPLGLAGETSEVVIDNWKLVPETMTEENNEYISFGIGEVGTWGQFKIVLSGKAGYPEIRQILVKTEVKEGL